MIMDLYIWGGGWMCIEGLVLTIFLYELHAWACRVSYGMFVLGQTYRRPLEWVVDHLARSLVCMDYCFVVS